VFFIPSRATIVPNVLSVILLLAAGRLSARDGSDLAFVLWLVIMLCLGLIWSSLTQDRPRRTIRRWRPVDTDDSEVPPRAPH
jgi:hypothetical protein